MVVVARRSVDGTSGPPLEPNRRITRGFLVVRRRLWLCLIIVVQASFVLSNMGCWKGRLEHEWTGDNWFGGDSSPSSFEGDSVKQRRSDYMVHAGDATKIRLTTLRAGTKEEETGAKVRRTRTHLDGRSDENVRKTRQSHPQENHLPSSSSSQGSSGLEVPKRYATKRPPRDGKENKKNANGPQKKVLRQKIVRRNSDLGRTRGRNPRQGGKTVRDHVDDDDDVSDRRGRNEETEHSDKQDDEDNGSSDDDRNDRDNRKDPFQDKNVEVAEWEYYPKLPQRVKESAIRNETNPFDEAQCQEYMQHFETSPPPLLEPSGGACDGYDGVLHIQHFDRGAASGTAFFQFTIGLLQWADQHNYLPWIHLDDGFTKPIWDEIVHTQIRPNSPHNFTMQCGVRIGWARDRRDEKYNKFPGRPVRGSRMPCSKPIPYTGTGVWEHYFLPPTDFVPGDSSCTNKPLVRMRNDQIVPGIHSLAPWAPRAWRHTDVEYIARMDLSWDEWFAPQRQHAAEIVRRYIRFNPMMERRAHCALPDPTFSLGMHIRHGDKYLERDVIATSKFLKYAEAFVDNGGGAIYVATDSARVLEKIKHEWPNDVASHVIHQPFVAGLTRNKTAAFNLGVSAHRTNIEALTDMLALSKCTFLLHGLSALSEAVFYLNPDLVGRSINLEYKDYEYKRSHTVRHFVNDIMPLGRPTHGEAAERARRK